MADVTFNPGVTASPQAPRSTGGAAPATAPAPAAAPAGGPGLAQDASTIQSGQASQLTGPGIWSEVVYTPKTDTISLPADTPTTGVWSEITTVENGNWEMPTETAATDPIKNNIFAIMTGPPYGDP